MFPPAFWEAREQPRRPHVVEPDVLEPCGIQYRGAGSNAIAPLAGAYALFVRCKLPLRRSFIAPPPCGEGLGVGVPVSTVSVYPPPRPSPARGEGAREFSSRQHGLLRRYAPR